MPPSHTPAPITCVEPVLAWSNRWVHVHDDHVRFPNGTPGRYLRIHPSGPGQGVVVAARRGDRYALVLTYRYPIGAWEWAFPRGFAQSPDAAATALAELAEETGATPESLHHLGDITPDSGMRSDTVACYLAELPDRDTAPSDAEEVHALAWHTLPQILTAVAAGELRDAFTLATVSLLLAAGRAHF